MFLIIIYKVLFVIVVFTEHARGGNPHAKRLYDDLLSNYNRLIRPVSNNTEKLTVRLGLKLSQLIDVDLKNQVMTTNVWVEQKWLDYKLNWKPEEYGGVEMLYVPSQHIWLPDIVLFNNADGKYEVTLMTKARLKYTGEVVWKPPAIYKSSCKINVEWFPFDEQSCDMKFGSWTYDGFQVDLKHVDQEKGSNVVKVGIDLKEFYYSVEWDILEVPATRNEEYYTNDRGEEDDYQGKLLTDITFMMTLRRKTLFYTVNLIIPCVGISFLTVLVFYLPSDSGEKVTLCISILLSLTVFFLLLAEIIPPTSLAVPLLGKYLLFTMILVTLSICVTVGVLNIHFRSPATHRMSPWMRKIFIHIMPRMLLMTRPHYIPRYSAEPPLKSRSNDDLMYNQDQDSKKLNGHCGPTTNEDQCKKNGKDEQDSTKPNKKKSISNVACALRGVEFIAQHIKNADKDNEVIEDWKFIAMVMDRLFLWLFTIACIMGTGGIILRAPSLYDMRDPIDAKLSEIPKF
ncbi:acetylcholine receptor subunit beta-like 2 [Lepeophtheirus salmonis]|uniref:Nicotinic acetylcholine receptor beta-2 subunit n=1 Tax=Lepeophtheirus salmonis TaxID=72036 RepID=A0A7S5Q7H3_LEPSM|nr:acetylcholine receptor subunit beta-like 2 [Lepeophtheirus salmonis]QHU23860.1 nicotinic acetylcholine receptor beta-2 subunit [Lepeophtheirus salmonis]